MKSTPTALFNAIQQTVTTPYLLVEIDFGGADTIRATTLPYDLEVDSETYYSDGGLVELSPPQLSNVMDREVYRLKIADLNADYRELFEAHAYGTPITVKLGIEGQSQHDVLYKGIIDATFLEINNFEGTMVASIEASSPFGALDRNQDRRTDRKTQRNIDENDSSMDNVYVNADEIALGWGRK